MTPQHSSSRHRPAILRFRPPVPTDRSPFRGLRVPDPGHLHGPAGGKCLRDLRLCHGPRPAHGKCRVERDPSRYMLTRGWFDRDLIAGVAQVVLAVAMVGGEGGLGYLLLLHCCSILFGILVSFLSCVRPWG